MRRRSSTSWSRVRFEEQARRARAAVGPAQVPGDRVRGRQRVPRRVEGRWPSGYRAGRLFEDAQSPGRPRSCRGTRRGAPSRSSRRRASPGTGCARRNRTRRPAGLRDPAVHVAQPRRCMRRPPASRSAVVVDQVAQVVAAVRDVDLRGGEVGLLEAVCRPSGCAMKSAVSGVICIRPRAPACEVWSRKRDSS